MERRATNRLEGMGISAIQSIQIEGRHSDQSFATPRNIVSVSRLSVQKG